MPGLFRLTVAGCIAAAGPFPAGPVAAQSPNHPPPGGPVSVGDGLDALFRGPAGLHLRARDGRSLPGMRPGRAGGTGNFNGNGNSGNFNGNGNAGSGRGNGYASDGNGNATD